MVIWSEPLELAVDPMAADDVGGGEAESVKRSGVVAMMNVMHQAFIQDECYAPCSPEKDRKRSNRTGCEGGHRLLVYIIVIVILLLSILVVEKSAVAKIREIFRPHDK